MKKLIVSLIASLIALLVTIPIFATEVTNEDLEGYWVEDGADGAGVKSILIISSDGTYEMLAYDASVPDRKLERQCHTGTYTIQEGYVVCINEKGSRDLIKINDGSVITLQKLNSDALMYKEENPEESNEESEESERSNENTSEKQITFRNYEWGTQFDEIYEKEVSEKNLSPDDYIEGDVGGYRGLTILSGDVAGYKASIIFTFDDNNGLNGGMYLLNTEHSNLTQYYKDYETLVDKYTSVYGIPSDVKEIWKDDLYKDDPSEWGMSIATGKTVFYTKWDDDKGNSVDIMLTGDNYEISTLISYEAGAYEVKENVDGI